MSFALVLGSEARRLVRLDQPHVVVAEQAVEALAELRIHVGPSLRDARARRQRDSLDGEVERHLERRVDRDRGRCEVEPAEELSELGALGEPEIGTGDDVHECIQ